MSAKPSVDLQPAKTPARTADDRQAELNDLFAKRFNAHLRLQMTARVLESYQRAPSGPHDDQTARVVRAFGRAPVSGKEVILPLGPDGPWIIARIAVGEPGGVVRLPGRFDTCEGAYRAIFASRWARLQGTSDR